MTNRTTTILLLAIGLGLWVHVANDWLRPVMAQAKAPSSQKPQDFIKLEELPQKVSCEAFGPDLVIMSVPKKYGAFKGVVTSLAGIAVAFESNDGIVQVVDPRTCQHVLTITRDR